MRGAQREITGNLIDAGYSLTVDGSKRRIAKPGDGSDSPPDATSTAEQASNGVSIEVQRRAVERVAKANGWEMWAFRLTWSR